MLAYNNDVDVDIRDFNIALSSKCVDGMTLIVIFYLPTCKQEFYECKKVKRRLDIRQTIWLKELLRVVLCLVSFFAFEKVM